MNINHHHYTEAEMEELFVNATKILVKTEKVKTEPDRTWQEHNEGLNVWTNGTMDDYRG
jgi:hypothetical protein